MSNDLTDNPTGERGTTENRDVLGELEAIDLSVLDRLQPLELELERLARLTRKLEEQRGSTSEEIFDEVQRDYLARRDSLETDAEQLRRAAQESRRQLDELLEYCRHSRDETVKAREILELRLRVGEFEGDSDAENRLVAARKAADDAERALEAVRQSVAQTGVDEGPDEGSERKSGVEAPARRDRADVQEPQSDATSGESSAREFSPEERPATDDSRGSERAESDSIQDWVDTENEDGEGYPTLKFRPVTDEPTSEQPVLSGATMSISRLRIPEIPTTVEPIVCLVSTDEEDIYYRLEPHMTVGRFHGSGHQIIIEDAAVSRQHARIRREKEGRFVVSDLGSSNGTFVNGDRIAERELELGDTVHFGNAGFEVRHLSDLVADKGNDRP